jgi:uncharacterized membrane protein
VTFEYLPSWWAWLLLLVALAALAYGAYAGSPVPLAPWRRRTLVILRLVTLLLLVGALLRPVALVPTSRWQDAVVPILVDTSRSMQLPDADGRPRIERAATLVKALLPRLQAFEVELLGFGERLAPVDLAAIAAEGRRSDLGGALRELAQRYRGRRVAGVVLVSDGGDTGGAEPTSDVAGVPPVYAIGVGSRRLVRDREVTGLTVGEPVLPGSTVTLSTTVIAHGFGVAPFEVRVLENGRPIQVRQVRPTGDGVPHTLTVQVSPAAETATLYTVELAVAPGELVAENNRMSVLVRPPGPQRRVLLVAGAPGNEHNFLRRALVRDPGLDVDAVWRKGQNDRGESTFYVQAHPDRARALTSGYPQDREALFAYDALVLGNVDSDALTTEQLAMTADFVGTRGGGVLVLGGRSFVGRGLIGTPLEDVLPLDLAGRGAVARTARSAAEPNTVVLTPEGIAHPVTALGTTAEETRNRWAALPPLAAVAPLGAPKPGALVLLLAETPLGRTPLLAVQRYGRGRAMVFTGEAAWRWRMRLPSDDRSYELFWRQAVRWLAGGAPGPVSVVATGGQTPGEMVRIEASVWDRRFEPIRDAAVTILVDEPGSTSRTVRAALVDATAGRYVAEFRPTERGVYRVRAEARRGPDLVGRAEDWLLVGGADPEFADPRLNDEVLRRLALATGGRFAFIGEVDPAALASALQAKALESRPLERRELWHRSWVFGLMLTGLLAEWILRRRWGLR